MHYPKYYSKVPQLVETQFEITEDAEGNFITTLVDYFMEHPTKRTQLPQVKGTYQEAHTYGSWWIEQSELPISQGFSKASLEVALNA